MLCPFCRVAAIREEIATAEVALALEWVPDDAGAALFVTELDAERTEPRLIVDRIPTACTCGPDANSFDNFAFGTDEAGKP